MNKQNKNVELLQEKNCNCGNPSCNCENCQCGTNCGTGCDCGCTCCN